MKYIYIKSYIRKDFNKFHIYHLLNPSLWPVVISGSIFSLVIAFVNTFYTSYTGWYSGLTFIFDVDISLVISLFSLLFIAFCWWSDVSSESGEHTCYTIRGLKIGMILFIVSEIMFFFSFFWSFFHVSLSPAIEVGSIWPPVGFNDLVLSYKKVPLLNTLLLLSSGVSVTYAHAALHLNFHYEKVLNTKLSLKYSNDFEGFSDFSFSKFVSYLMGVKYLSILTLLRGVNGLWITLQFAITFIILQLLEYFEAFFNISDSCYGSTFFVMTGFHGLHVLIGTIFLFVCLLRILDNKFYFKSSTGLEAGIWYWHFVDVVWLFLYISIYWWGNMLYNDIFFEGFWSNCDFAVEYQDLFQDPATSFMEDIISLHNYVMYFLVFIAFILIFLLLEITE